jgi:N-acetylmuramoyl-L-alanine amidase
MATRTKIAIGSWIVASLVSAPAAQAPATPAALYADAMAREQAVRGALGDERVAPAVLKDVRSTVAAYEAVVRRFPTSGYCDNALWQAGRLALDAFARFGESRDRELGVRLLAMLAAEYPYSRLAKQVATQLEQAGSSVRSASATPSLPSPTATRPADPGNARAAAASSTAVAPSAATGATATSPAPKNPVATAGAGTVGVGTAGAGTGLQAGPRKAAITDVRRTVLPEAVRITIEIDAEVPFRDERLAGPPRVFVDLPSTRAAPSLLDQVLRFDGDDDIVRQVRLGRQPNNTTRVVLEAGGVGSYSVYPLYNPYRVVIDCERQFDGTSAVAHAGGLPEPTGSPHAVQDQPPPTAARAPALDPVRDAPPVARQAAAGLRSTSEAQLTDRPLVDGAASPVDTRLSAAPSPKPEAAARPPSSVAPPLTNLTGGFSIARQLGLGVSRIVIDPGHGGHDPGAMGKGVDEAELVLDVALRLEALLMKIPGVEVILTRRTNEYIPLAERTALANREAADLFLSIHANASPSAQARGVETYFLNFASNLSAAAVAARENAASGQAMGSLPDFVKAITLNNKLDESRDFATLVQRAMVQQLRGSNKTLKDLGVRQAPFVVLIGAAMPSVLAEISFVTNAQEARLLRSGPYRQRIAEALLNAIRKYQTSLKTVTRVAHQD